MTSRRTPLVVEDLEKVFHGEKNFTAVDGVSFEIEDGAVYTLLGPSGCGKTTTLRCVAGLESATGGRVIIDGHPVSEAGSATFVPPHRRDVGMVFQSYGIWPHMTVFENAAFPLRVRRPKVNKAEIHQRTEEALATVQLHGLEGRMATALSGGQQQRLALARALVRQPQLLLLDEPLSNLDAKLRVAMRAELVALQQRLGLTILYVTHDQQEALSMSDRIAVMSGGRIVQEGRPREIYHRPTSRFVADFVGATNLVEGRTGDAVNGDEIVVETPAGRVQACAPTVRAEPGVSVFVAIRPEDVVVHSGDVPPDRPNVLEGAVVRTMFLGETLDCHVRIGTIVVVARQNAWVDVNSGARVWLEFPAERCTVLPNTELPSDVEGRGGLAVHGAPDGEKAAVRSGP